MVDCFFKLNGKPMSELAVEQQRFPAFSGLTTHVNRREYACLASAGPIPPGTYYIFDRQSGGMLGSLRDLFHDHSQWFALYAVDNKIDDEMFCNQVKRGNFRLHPRGVLGISQGCITLDSIADFQKLRARLKSGGQMKVPGTDLKAYGRVIVK